ncbi:hypothetical protein METBISCDRAFT_28810 [Metschnikowia bicuspidata]|uniref:Hyphally-regulated cell wall protein N-terminal domain-containing protein n=1 Tax=Metschnikowia bicuspidata TaxID=27322 RepID=A0A4P9Z7X6_9ASCO|nr:hypothetical protein METBISCDRAFT_28810 [Metschnikowia bicuspidata]
MKLLGGFALLLAAVHANFFQDFRLKVMADTYSDAVVVKSNGYYVIETLEDSGEIFKFGDGNILVDSDQVSLIVGNSGEVRGALTDEVPIPGFFFFDNNYDLKLKSGDDFYVCELQSGTLGLWVGHQQGCTKVELVKHRIIY